jgi:hypothetical protein
MILNGYNQLWKKICLQKMDGGWCILKKPNFGCKKLLGIDGIIEVCIWTARVLAAISCYFLHRHGDWPWK